ncbi:hypothetical protein BU15DRAFT_70382 [Melanogaster broomeanus]|nr:hypothetical protein BU15DRAFT_70382 [Melanogaster broomeanus]
MPAIVAPSPRLAPHFNMLQSEILSQEVQLVQRPFSPSVAPLLRRVDASYPYLTSSPSSPQQTISPRSFLSPPRLLSPIILGEPPYVALNSKSPTPCGSACKRRPLRVRPVPRGVAVISNASTAPSIPLDVHPSLTNFPGSLPSRCHEPLDAISQISHKSLSNEHPSAFPDVVPAFGPVRRRKTSLRSNPLGNGHDAPSDELPSRQLFPFHRSADSAPTCPKTPLPRIPFDPSQVTFHNLMPVFPHGLNPGTPFRGL